jgi:dihydrofolate reductase
MESNMSKKIVVTQQYVSLDGVLEDPVGMEGSGLGNWTGPFSRGPDGDRFKLDELLAADSLIFGRKTYDAFAAAWPSMKDEAAPSSDSLIGDYIWTVAKSDGAFRPLPIAATGVITRIKIGGPTKGLRCGTDAKGIAAFTHRRHREHRS